MNPRGNTLRISLAAVVALVAVGALGLTASFAGTAAPSQHALTPAEGLAKAKQLLAVYESVPKLVIPKLVKKPPTGKTIVFLQNPNQAPTTIQMGDEVTKA